jgi:23S rRNA pseudouridine1911/1915/1917 synthase
MTLPRIVRETPLWAVLEKPHGMPSAPLTAGEEGTLLGWFLERCPEAACVAGRKTIECGLLHRLDTGTSGLVLVAKTQGAFDCLLEAQTRGAIRKSYYAFCTRAAPAAGDATLLPGVLVPPLVVRSRFRAFGPGRREVRPLFAGQRGYEEAETDYETAIDGFEALEDPSAQEKALYGISCTLLRGYRHQVRAHLASLGFPLAGDPLYNAAGGWNPLAGQGTSPAALCAGNQLSRPRDRTSRIRFASATR